MSEKLYKRWAVPSVGEALSIWRSVFIAGVRQCGKTTLAHQALPGGEFRTLDDSALLDVATDDPAGFVKRRDGSIMVIDEIQKAPKLLPEIKRILDADNAKGQYLLTGSADIKTLPAVTESLAGRMGTIRLRPLACGEITGAEPDFLDRAFAADFHASVKGFDKDAILEIAFRGGYPEPLYMKGPAKRQWFKSYLDALLLHDIRKLMDVRAYAILRKMMEVLLARSAKFFSENEIMSALGIGHETFTRFLAILKTLYLVDEIPPWTSSDYAATGKRSKFVAADTGMMAAILNWKLPDVALDSDRSGKVVESWVYNQIAPLADLAPGRMMTQFRDSRKREIDFMVESDEGRTLGIEVKAGSLTSGFGYRIHPVTGGITFHFGTDFAAEKGSPVSCAADGTVLAVGDSTTYGIYVIVDHGSGVKTLYAHLDATSLTDGQSVTKGGAIGAAGETGNATSPCVHFEITYNGVFINPEYYI